jgi:signal transduction histidine kinase/ActR/RegA family two-component response regulator
MPEPRPTTDLFPEDLLRRILDRLADAVVVVDSEGVVKLANPAAEELFARPAQELVGDCFGLPLVAGETTEVDLKGGQNAEMRVVELPWEGQPAWLASLRDVTMRRRAEEAARSLWRERTAREAAEEERRRLEELLARAPAAILTTRDSEHVCVFVNPQMEKLVAGRPLIGSPLHQALPELAGQGFLEGFVATFDEGKGRTRMELSLTLSSGATDDTSGVERFLDVTWEPLRRNGGVDGVLCFAYDVTDQVGLRRELEEAMERLREEERAKDHFLAVLGHELRNPLAGIDGGLRLLEAGADEEKGRWALGMMRRQVGVLASLLDDLFDVSAVARGKLELQKQVLILEEVVELAVAATRSRFEERQQRLTLAISGEALPVEGDPRRLEQVLANLLVNASKYSDAGTTVELRVRREVGEAVVEVADQGAGIQPELLEHIFEPFVQARTGFQISGGLGIGLTLVRQLVELHGGSVAATSPGLGKGSTFTVRLPLAAAEDSTLVPPSIPSLQGETADPGVHGRRILVVEDNEDVARSLAELLTASGCTTDIATTGSEAIAKALAEAPDTLLVDLDLPDISGFEVARKVRAERGPDGMLIVAISGFGHQRAQERSKESGIDHHLVKPVDVELLMDLLALHPPGGCSQQRPQR